ncbi:MAG: MurR/RpiR family transcriptional regulator [Collinsella sp.]
MDIKRKITEAQGLTPTEQQLGISALAMGEDIRGLSIKEFAARANVSVASVHRFCKKLGLEGFKDLKVELIRLATEAGSRRRPVDINYHFDATSTPRRRLVEAHGRVSTRPRWPRRRSCSTPRSSTTPPN